MQRIALCLAGLTVGVATTQLTAQPEIPMLIFTNAYATETTFHFEANIEFGTNWLIEYQAWSSNPPLTDPNPSWLPYPLPAPGGRVFDVPLDRPVQFFRARYNDIQRSIYSHNMAYYVRSPLTNGFALLANPYDIGPSNRLSEIMPAPPPGTRAYKFDPGPFHSGHVWYNTTPSWAAVSQFVWDAWTPDLSWERGEGLAFVLPRPFNHTFAGPAEQPPFPPYLRPGANLIGLPLPPAIPGWCEFMPCPSLQDGDTVLLYDIVRRQYDAFQFISEFGWSPTHPDPALGQGFWLIREFGPGLTTSIYFNNYVPEAGIDAPLSYAGRLIEGTNWLAQLYYSLTGPPDTPAGTPVPFRSGAAAGYVDTSEGGVVTLPCPAGTPVNVQIRYWQTDGPGSGWTEPITVQCGTAQDSAPPLPANLTGLGGSTAMHQAHLSRPEWTSGQFRFRFSGRLENNYVIETSTTLTNWSVLQTLSNLTGPLFLTDPNCRCPGARFYRARPVAP